MNPAHLHRDDCPRALAALAEVLQVSRRDPGALRAIGYEPTEHGARVDWDALGASFLSSTEKAAVVVIEGAAIAEARGGWPARVRQALVEAITGDQPTIRRGEPGAPGEEVAGVPVAWMVAEYRGGWLFGDDWSRECASRAEAERVAQRWTEHPQTADVGVFAVVPVAVTGEEQGR